MHPSVHRSPWPSPEEFTAVPAPEHAVTWQAAIRIVEHVRRAKADASLSMAAPVKEAAVVCTPDWQQAIEAISDDLCRTMRIETWSLASGTPQEGDIEVTVIL